MHKIKILIFLLFYLSTLTATMSYKIGVAEANTFSSPYSQSGNHYKLNFYRLLDSTSLENTFLTNGIQYIYFGENVVSNETWSGLQIREGERSFMVDVGLKKYFEFKNGSF